MVTRVGSIDAEATTTTTPNTPFLYLEVRRRQQQQQHQKKNKTAAPAPAKNSSCDPFRYPLVDARFDGHDRPWLSWDQPNLDLDLALHTEKSNHQALGVCLGLHDAKNATVRSAADMTVRQIISLLFDRVADELGVTAGAAAGAAGPAAAQAGAPGAGSISGSVHVDDGEAGAEEAVIEEEDEEGGAGAGALRCAHLVFQVRKRARVGVGESCFVS